MDRPYCAACNNTGEVDCYCGGDMCVCSNYGVMPCPKCDGEWGDDDELGLTCEDEEEE